jgi:hypothetical protein
MDTRLGLDPAFGQQFLIERVADRAVDVLHIPLPDVRGDVVSGVVTPVLDHRWLDRMFDAGQPLIQGGAHLALGLCDDLPALILGDCVAACFPGFPFGLVPASVRLSAFAGKRVGLNVE